MSRFYYQDPDAPEPNVPYQLGALAIIEKGGCVLLEQRSDGGQWSLIGGGLEPNESVPECMIREVKEETGLEVLSYSLFGIFSDPSRIMAFENGVVARGIAVVFRARVRQDELLLISDESLQLKWIPKEDLASIDIIAMQTEVIRKYLQECQEPFLG